MWGGDAEQLAYGQRPFTNALCSLLKGVTVGLIVLATRIDKSRRVKHAERSSVMICRFANVHVCMEKGPNRLLFGWSARDVAGLNMMCNQGEPQETLRHL